MQDSPDETQSPEKLVARFCYDDYRDLGADEADCRPEPTTDGEWAVFAELIAENEDDMGALVLERGAIEIRIEDSLMATAANLCFGAIPDLVDRKHVVVKHFSSYGYLRLDPEASDQLISGDFVPKVRLPRAELIPALVGVGERYLQFVEKMRGNDDERQKHLHEMLGAAKSALSRWDGT